MRVGDSFDNSIAIRFDEDDLARDWLARVRRTMHDVRSPLVHPTHPQVAIATDLYYELKEVPIIAAA